MSSCNFPWLAVVADSWKGEKINAAYPKNMLTIPFTFNFQNKKIRPNWVQLIVSLRKQTVPLWYDCNISNTGIVVS